MFNMNRRSRQGGVCSRNAGGQRFGKYRMGNGMRQGTGIGNNDKPQGRGLGCNQGYGTGFGRRYESLSDADKKAFLEESIKTTKTHLEMMEKTFDDFNKKS